MYTQAITVVFLMSNKDKEAGSAVEREMQSKGECLYTATRILK